MTEPWGLFHKTLQICKLRIYSYGQISTVNLLIISKIPLFLLLFCLKLHRKKFYGIGPWSAPHNQCCRHSSENMNYDLLLIFLIYVLPKISELSTNLKCSIYLRIFDHAILWGYLVIFRTCSKQVLTGLNLTIRKGETVALVGSSGCGKSTCIQLIQRFYDPDFGSIRLGKRDIKDLNIGWLRDR